MSFLVPATGGIQVNTFTSYEQDDARIAALPNGGFVVVWEALDASGERNDVFQQVYDAAGNPVGGNVRLNTSTAHTNYNPVVEILNDGSWVVVWGEYGEDGGVSEVKARMIGADGIPRAAAFTVNTFTYGEQGSPDVSATEDGGFIVVWESYHVSGAHGVETVTLNIRSREFDSSGVGESHDATLLYSMDDSRFPDVTTLENGEVFVAWQEPVYDGDGNRIVSRNGGVLLTDDVYFEGHSSAFLLREEFSGIYSVEALEDNRFVVAGWTVIDGVNQVVVQVYESGPYRFEAIAEPVYMAVPGLDVYAPRIAVTPDGGFVVTYTVDTIPGYADAGGQEDTYVQRFDADGQKAGAPVRVSEVSGPGQYHIDPDIAVLEDGRIVSVWEGYPDEGDTSGVYIRVFESQMVGTSKRDILRGSAADDQISGRGGNDLLAGRSGSDRIEGGRGWDTLNGHSGRDQLDGGRGRDMLDGGAGRDVLIGGGGDDWLQGGAGRDLLIGGRGSDRLDGGAGNDLLKGGRGADEFVFSSGRDRIASFTDGTDTLLLDAGALELDGMGVQEVLETYGSLTGSGAAVLDFGGGNALTIGGVSSLSSLADDIVFI
ncbi:calcium-binding protein [Leisingera sp. ANG-M1]|uniref:calcium-binding protein n=1 Tax=Leisingera sp. ANG-M1 TaxID=1577895 RepID=UPI00068F6268|nr:calcium-binding protein [Leisingera sp. ANG-M1]